MNNPRRIFGLIGYPLGHSFSKKFFTDKFEKEKINAEYLNFEITSITKLPQVLHDYPGLCGFNVTIPYKTAIIDYLDDISPAAKKIGAVNTVKISYDSCGNKILSGHNTDIIGFCDSLRPYLPDEPLKALVLGSGGASKAIVCGLKSLGISSLIVSRNPTDGQISYSDIDLSTLNACRIIVNTTPLGMFPEINACPNIPYHLISSRHICFDAIYNPAQTLFLKKCKERGATTINGLGMLHGQAIAAWKIWNGR